MIKILFAGLDTQSTLPLTLAVWNQVVEKSNIIRQFEADIAVLDEENLDLPIDESVYKIAERNNLNLNNKCKVLSFKDIENYDFILALDSFTQAEVLNQKWKVLKPRAAIYMLRQFDHTADSLIIPATKGPQSRRLEDVLEIIERSINNFIEVLQEQFRL